MIETISVLFIFFILIIIGVVFFARVQGWGMKTQIEEAVQKKAVNIVQIASFLPELQCSEENVVKDNCIDIKKAEVVKDIFTDNIDYYFDIFGYAKIEIIEIYFAGTPGLSDTVKMYDRTLPDSKSQLVTKVPILLKDPINKKYNFGLMNITTYSK